MGAAYVASQIAHFTRDFIYDFCFGLTWLSSPAYIHFLWLSLIADGTTGV